MFHLNFVVNARVSPWGTIVLLEYWIYRRTRGYDLDLWWSQKGLPYGIAASISFSCSVVLAIMSMSQVWYVGPIALAAGGEPYGVDLGWCVVNLLAKLSNNSGGCTGRIDLSSPPLFRT